MSTDKTTTGNNTAVTGTIDTQAIERAATGASPPAATPQALPWTAKFHLPSIRFRAPKRA